MLDLVNTTPTAAKRAPWNKGKLTGQSRHFGRSTSGRYGPSYKSRGERAT